MTRLRFIVEVVHKQGIGMAYEKPVLVRLGSLTEMTLTKQLGGQDFLGQISQSIGGPAIGWVS